VAPVAPVTHALNSKVVHAWGGLCVFGGGGGLKALIKPACFSRKKEIMRRQESKWLKLINAQPLASLDAAGLCHGTYLLLLQDQLLL